MLARPLAAAVTAAFLLGLLPAHGGQYRGGNDNPPGPGAPPPTPGVKTGVRPLAPTSVMWQTWWEFNKDHFIQRRTVVAEAGPVTGSDDFFLGTRRASDRVDVLAPTIVDLRDVLVPALAGMIDKERNRDIVTACLVALGKIGRDGPGVDLEAVMTHQIRRDDQEVRETAVLSLGIAGRDRALPLLVDLATDTPAGRRLEDRTEGVRDRTRAFAAFGLGLLGRRSKDVAVKQRVHEVCLELAKDSKTERELRVAAISSLGILDLDGSGVQKRLMWLTVDELMELFARDVGPAEEMILAHAPVAVARLLGRGASELHQRCKARFAEELTVRSKRGSSIRRGAAIALGALSLAPEDEPMDAPFSKALQQAYGGEPHTKLFASISLGRIGGAGNRAFLLSAYQKGDKLVEKPWAAIALGLLTFEAGSKGEPDATVAQIFTEDLVAAKEDTLRGALAVALGLTGQVEAAPTMLKVLLDNERDQMSAGYLCVGLGLLGDRTMVDQLALVLDRSVRRPFLMQNCAIGLGMLGDRDASGRLLEKIKESDSVAVLASLATSIGRIGDRRSIAPLIELMHDDERTKLARAFVCAALGGIGDKDRLPWNLPLSRDCNYASPTETLTNGATGVLDIL